MTVREILDEVTRYKPMTRENLYLHFKKIKLKPIGVRQVPQQYPDDSGVRVLIRLGFKKPTRKTRKHSLAKQRRRK